MMFKKCLRCFVPLVMMLSIQACGGKDDKYLFGDAVADLSKAFCDKYYECWGASDDLEGIETCAKHNTYHLCELQGTCGLALTPEQEDVAAQCVLELEAIEAGSNECLYLAYYGLVPQACLDVITFADVDAGQ